MPFGKELILTTKSVEKDLKMSIPWLLVVREEEEKTKLQSEILLNIFQLNRDGRVYIFIVLLHLDEVNMFACIRSSLHLYSYI